MRDFPIRFTTVMLFVLPLALVVAVACGGASETEQSATGQAASAQSAAPAAPAATAPPAAAVSAPAATTAPAGGAVAAATATPEAAAPMVGDLPVGTITVGQKELGPFMGHPSLAGNPQIFVMQTPPIGESLLTVSSALEPTGMLAKSWSASEDGTTWTFHLEEGVQFHKGYGEMTAEDVIYSMRQFGAEGSKHPRASNIRRIWENPEGHAEAIDDYTVEVNAGEPWSEVPINEFLTSPSGAGTWIISKKQSEELGAEGSQRTDRRHRFVGPGGVPDGRVLEDGSGPGPLA